MGTIHYGGALRHGELRRRTGRPLLPTAAAASTKKANCCRPTWCRTSKARKTIARCACARRHSSMRSTGPTAAASGTTARLLYVYKVELLEPQVDVNMHRPGADEPVTSVMSRRGRVLRIAHRSGSRSTRTRSSDRRFRPRPVKEAATRPLLRRATHSCPSTSCLIPEARRGTGRCSLRSHRQCRLNWDLATRAAHFISLPFTDVHDVVGDVRDGVRDGDLNDWLDRGGPFPLRPGIVRNPAECALPSRVVGSGVNRAAIHR